LHGSRQNTGVDRKAFALPRRLSALHAGADNVDGNAKARAFAAITSRHDQT